MGESHDHSFNIFDVSQQLISPLYQRRPPINVQSRHPFVGQYDFHLDFKNVELPKDYKLYTGPNGKRVLFVNRDKPFVIRILFRLPLTPSNLWIRIIPLFTSHSRRNEAVFRCPNHTYQSVSKSPAISMVNHLESPHYADASRSLICIQNPQAMHCYLEGHLTVLLRLDQCHLAMSLKPSSPCPNKKRRSSAKGSPHVPFLISQSTPDECSPSYPMGVTAEDLVCRLGCYNSCFGGQPRGGIELIVRLEELPEDPSLPPIVHGLDSVEIHCSSTPGRDIRNYSENIAKANRKASTNTLQQSQTISGVIKSSPPPSPSINCHEGPSTSSAITSGNTLSSGASRSKRRLALAGGNLGGNGASEGRGCDGNDDDFSILSQSSTISSQHLTTIPTSSPRTGTSPPIELLDSRGRKKVYYLLLTESSERAEWFRFYDNASTAFLGSRLSSSRFTAYGRECLRNQNIVAQIFSANSENFQPPQ
nr:p53 transcription factor DNA binding [Hymenolepis microstoma]